MASTNKCLAQINKSGTDSNATKKFTVKPAQFVRWPISGKTNYGSALPAIS
jgi:hypothetical protein